MAAARGSSDDVSHPELVSEQLRVTVICWLPPELRDRVYDFFDRAYKEDSGVDEGSILSRLVTLRNEIMQCVTSSPSFVAGRWGRPRGGSHAAFVVVVVVVAVADPGVNATARKFSGPPEVVQPHAPRAIDLVRIGGMSPRSGTTRRSCSPLHITLPYTT